VFGGYFDPFDGSQSIFPFQHVAWREVENDDKLCFLHPGNVMKWSLL
jgi:hypothetical protein